MRLKANEFFILVIKLLRRYFRYSRLIDTFLYEKVFRYLFVSFLSRQSEIVFRGKSLIINTSDLSLSPSLITGEFEKRELDWLLSRYSKKAKKCLLIDIGANIGIYPCFFLSCSTSFHAICFEPDPRNIKFLEANLASNIVDSKQWTIFNAAVSNVCGKSFLQLMPNNGQSHLTRQTVSEDRLLEVETVTLQKVVSEIDISSYQEILIKMDVEGSELDILSVPGKILTESNVSWLIEFNPTLTDRQKFLDVMHPYLDKYGEVGIFAGDKFRKYPSHELSQRLPFILTNILLESNS